MPAAPVLPSPMGPLWAEGTWELLPLSMLTPRHISPVGFTVWSSADCDRQHHFICKFTPLQ